MAGVTVTQRTNGVLTQVRQDLAEGEGPQNAYLMTSGSVYVFGVGKKENEATAFFKDNGSGVYILDNNSAEEDTTAVYVSSTVYVLNG